MLLPYKQALARGERYYLGRPCVHGHAEGKRFTKNGYCARCNSIRHNHSPAWKARKKKRRAAMMRRTRLRRPELKAAHNARHRVHRALKGTGLSGTALLGCSREFFRQHLESLWEPGMSWDNYGLGADKWNIDHRRPLASFDLSDPTQLTAACHYTNLQPMWQIDNVRKGANYRD